MIANPSPAADMAFLSDMEVLDLPFGDQLFLFELPEPSPEKGSPWFHIGASKVTAGEIRARLGLDADEESRRVALLVSEIKARGYEDRRDYSEVRRELIRVVK